MGWPEEERMEVTEFLMALIAETGMLMFQVWQMSNSSMKPKKLLDLIEDDNHL